MAAEYSSKSRSKSLSTLIAAGRAARLWASSIGPEDGSHAAPVTSSLRARAMGLAAQHLGGELRRCRIDGEGGCSLQPGDHPQTGVELPVPMEGLIEAFAGRSGVQDQVVGWVAELSERTKGPVEGRRSGRD